VTRPVELHVLSAGAAKALVEAAAETMRAAGVSIVATFDAAGAIRAQLESGMRCDLVILPAAMLDALAARGRVETPAALGSVPTGIAVPGGHAQPGIRDADALRAALQSAPALYCPDTERATAGMHFVRVLRELGIHDAVAGRIRAHPNGATAMAAMARERLHGAIGCTQVSEILHTPGVSLVGALEPPFDLATVYSVAVVAASRNPAPAREFAAQLAAPATRAGRAAKGFVALL
jgi:molybdate transport system substrate-binding protein